MAALLSILAVIVLASCAAAPPPPPPPPAATPTPAPLPAPSPAADLWDAPRSVLTEAGFRVVEEDRAKGVLVGRRTERISTPSERKAAIAELRRVSHLDDPRVGGAAQRMSEYAITVRVRMGAAESAEFSMAVKAEIELTDEVTRDGKKKTIRRPVPSRGVLENELLAKIRKRLEE